MCFIGYFKQTSCNLSIWLNGISHCKFKSSSDTVSRSVGCLKFPLLAKWGCLNKLLAEAQESECEEVTIGDFPGGAGCFEMCAKFCYGITITLSPHNVGEVRCGAEYLQMSETTEKGNLIYKLDVFLNSSILRGWKDTIICLQYSKAHMPWAEDIKVSLHILSSQSIHTCILSALYKSCWLEFSLGNMQ